jgi:hypothetical protein
MTSLDVMQSGGDVILTVKVVPGSSRTIISGQLEGMLKIKLSAPPEKGKANQCLIDFLAKQIGIKKNTVQIVAGSTSPIKRIRISNISAEKVANVFTTP